MALCSAAFPRGRAFASSVSSRLAGGRRAAPAAASGHCDPVMATADVTTGMTGTGWTVAQGAPRFRSTSRSSAWPRTGSAGARHDRRRGLSPELDEAGGIWAGMSGSPVYVGGELLGAVGVRVLVRPVEDRRRHARGGHGRPARHPVARADRDPRAAQRPADVGARTHGREPHAARRSRRPDAHAAAGAALDLRDQHARLQRSTPTSRTTGDSFIPYAGTSTTRAPAASGDPLEPGDNFASCRSPTGT